MLKMNENKRLIKNTFLLSIGGLTPKFIGLITLPIATRNLTTGEYGTYDLVITVAAILIPLLTLQIQQGTFRFLLTAKDQDERKVYITSTLVYLSFTVILGTIVGVIGMFIAGIRPLVALCICLMISAEVLYIVLGQTLRGMGKNGKYTLAIIVYSVSYMLFMIVLVAWLKLSLLGVLLAVAIGYLFSAIYMICQNEIRYYFHPKYYSKADLKRILAFSAPIVPSSISLWVVNMSDRLIVTGILGFSANGIYSAANKIPSLYSTAYSIFNMAWTESAVRSYENDDASDYYSRMFRALFHFMLGVILLLIAATPMMFAILFDVQYDDAYYQIPILYFGVFFSSIVSFYGSIYIAVQQTKHVASSSIAGAVINVVVNLLLIRWIGLYAASISTAVSYLCICIYRYFDLKKMIEIKYYFPEMILGILMFSISAVCCHIRNVYSIILCIVIAIGYNIAFNRHMLINFFNVIFLKIRKRG